MPECDVILCGDVGVDYSMVAGATLNCHSVAPIVKEVRALGGAAGSRAKFLAQRGVRVNLIANNSAQDGNGRFVEKELQELPAIRINYLQPSTGDTLYRVLIVTPEQAHRLIYERPLPLKSESLLQAMEEALSDSPHAVVACQANWWPQLMRRLSESDRPVLVWHELEGDQASVAMADVGSDMATYIVNAVIPPRGWQWEFAVQRGSAHQTAALQWHLPQSDMLDPLGASTADVAFFAAMVRAAMQRSSIESAIDYAGKMASLQARGEPPLSFPPL